MSGHAIDLSHYVGTWVQNKRRIPSDEPGIMWMKYGGPFRIVAVHHGFFFDVDDCEGRRAASGIHFSKFVTAEDTA